MKNSSQEVGSLVFTTVYTKTGLPLNITARADDAKDSLKELIETITWAMAEYGISTEKPQPPAASQPKADPAAAIVAADGNREAAAEIQKQAEAVPPSRKGANVQYQTIDAATIEVLPQPDGKTTIKFYGDGDKYPRVSVNKWKVEAANGLMKHVTSEPMDKAAKYTLPCRVYFTDGASYQSDSGETKHYKDVEHVRSR